jgi:hypothetical protein
MREYELLNITRANQNQQGYDILALPVLGSTNEKLTCYISVKLGLPDKNSSSIDARYKMSVNACADSLVKTMIVHLNNSNSIVDDMSNVYFIIYNWALDINLGNRTYSNDYENNQSNIRKKWSDYIDTYIGKINNESFRNTINSYKDKYFDSNLFIITKYEMKDWLIPSMAPLPDLFSIIVKPDNTSSTDSDISQEYNQ